MMNYQTQAPHILMAAIQTTGLVLLSATLRSLVSSVNLCTHSFIYSFGDISIVSLQVYYYAEVLPTTALTLCQSYHVEESQTTMTEGIAQRGG